MSDRSIKFSIGAGAASAVIVTILNILIQPILINHYGKQVYGIYVIISSVSIYVGLLNLGIPTATLVIANKATEAEKIFRNGYIFSISLSAILILLSLFLCYIIPIQIFEGSFSSLKSSSSHYALTAAVISVALKFPVQIILNYYVHKGNQVPVRLFDSTTALAAFISALLAISLDLGVEYVFYFSALLFFAVHIIATFAIRGETFAKIIKKCKVSVDWTVGKNILKRGLVFTILSFPVTISLTIDNFIIAHYHSIDKVTDYSLSSKIFIYYYSFINLYAVSIFGLIGSKIREGEYLWVDKRVSSGATFTSIINGIICIAVLLFIEDVLLLWTGRSDIEVPIAYKYLMGLYFYTLPLVNITSSMLTGTNNLKAVTKIAIFEVVVHLAVSSLLIPKYGITGAAAALFLSSLLVPYLLLPIINQRIHSFLGTSFIKTNAKLFLCSFIPVIGLLYVVESQNLFKVDFIDKILILLCCILIYSLLMKCISIFDSHLKEIKYDAESFIKART